MGKYLLLVIVTALTTAFAVREFLPRTLRETKTIPVIVPKYDTVETLPKWYKDSVRYWKKRTHTTDTIPLLISSTIVAAAPINISATPSERPDIWPLLDYSGGTRRGDTAIIGSLSLRSGRVAIHKFYIPGILTGIHTDSANSVPKLDFAPFPEPKKPSLLYKVKMIGIGFGACTIYNGVK